MRKKPGYIFNFGSSDVCFLHWGREWLKILVTESWRTSLEANDGTDWKKQCVFHLFSSEANAAWERRGLFSHEHTVPHKSSAGDCKTQVSSTTKKGSHLGAKWCHVRMDTSWSCFLKYYYQKNNSFSDIIISQKSI